MCMAFKSFELLNVIAARFLGPKMIAALTYNRLACPCDKSVRGHFKNKSWITAGERASHGVVPASGYAVCCGVSSEVQGATLGLGGPINLCVLGLIGRRQPYFMPRAKRCLITVCAARNDTHQDLVLSLHQAGITSERASGVSRRWTAGCEG